MSPVGYGQSPAECMFVHAEEETPLQEITPLQLASACALCQLHGRNSLHACEVRQAEDVSVGEVQGDELLPYVTYLLETSHCGSTTRWGSWGLQQADDVSVGEVQRGERQWLVYPYHGGMTREQRDLCLSVISQQGSVCPFSLHNAQASSFVWTHMRGRERDSIHVLNALRIILL